jgi:prepilin-type N-terminal cleavage/methylation domain-containing protein
VVRKGFTLIELLVVVGILGLLLSLSFPALSSFRGIISLNASAQVLASQLRKTQSQALCENENREYGRFKFSRTGFPLPGGTGTQILTDSFGRTRKVILSSAGRVRVE